jgi:toxin FitB
VSALPAHVVLEAYSVLTRLPGGAAVPAGAAASVLARRFGGEQLSLAEPRRAEVLRTLAEAGVFGGAAYDGLVALEAAAHDRVLLTLDRRAVTTYQRLGAPFRLIGS